MKKRRTGQTADRFVEETVALIRIKGGASAVTLREVAARVGCAHTNVYNYFAGFDSLLWEAYRHALRIYVAHLTVDLPAEGCASEYLGEVLRRLTRFPHAEPGIFRFISTDPLDIASMPADVLEMIAAMRQWFVDIIVIAGGLPPDGTAGQAIADILLAYTSGESLDAINGRVLPGDDIESRVVGNATLLFSLLTADAQTKGECRAPRRGEALRFPALQVG